MALLFQLFKDLDGIGDAGVERVVGIHQQDAVIRVDIRVGVKGVQLAAAQADDGLDHAVGMRAAGLIAQDG